MAYHRILLSKFGSPDVLQWVEEKQLPEPENDQVRIRIQKTSAAFTDTMIRKGIYPDVTAKPPFSPGYDLVGVIDKVGSRVTRFNVGQTVAALTVIGAYSEYLCVAEKELAVVPEELDSAEVLSLVLSYMTAYQMLYRVAQVTPGQRVLVHGAGGAVGTALLQLGKLNNLQMYGTGSASKQDVISRMGATVIDYQSEDFVERIKVLTEGGVDIVFDPIGGKHINRSLQTLRPGGKLIAYGFHSIVTGKGGSIILDFIRVQLRAIFNFLPFRPSVHFYSIGALKKQHPDWFFEDLSKLFQLLKDKKIKPEIWKTMPLNQAAQAHKLIEEAAVKGKIVLQVQPESNKPQ